MLCCLGDLVEDIVVHLSSPIVEASDTDVEIVRRRGGSAANVAVAAAGEGEQCRFIGRVGDDIAAGLLLAELEQAGVEPRVQQAGRTGSIVVLVDSAGERSMLRDRGAAGELETVDPAWLKDVSWLHVPAYSLVGEPTASASREAIRRIQRRAVPVSVDASSTAVIEEYGSTSFLSLIEECAPQVLLCNVEEAAALFGDNEPRLAGTLVVVKDGPGPACAFDPGGHVDRVPARQIDHAVNTTGAGDAFAGGFIVASMRESSVHAALEAGHRAAEALMTTHSP